MKIPKLPWGKIFLVGGVAIVGYLIVKKLKARLSPSALATDFTNKVVSDYVDPSSIQNAVTTPIKSAINWASWTSWLIP